jgi:hypothetical protein
MGRRLAAAVHVRHPKTNDWLILQPGDEPDEELAEAITNPEAWEDDAEEDGGDVDQDPDAGGPGPDPVPDPEPAPQPEPEPAPEAEPVKPARSRSRKAADEQ